MNLLAPSEIAIMNYDPRVRVFMDNRQVFLEALRGHWTSDKLEPIGEIQASTQNPS